MEINKGLTNRLVPNNIKITKDSDIAKLIDSYKSENTSVNLQNTPEDISAQSLKDILPTLNLSSSSEKQSLTLANNLLVNSLPVTKENIQVLNQALKLFEENPVEKGVFFLKNDLKPTQDLANQLNMYITKEIKISSQLIDTLSNISDVENLEEAIDILTNSKEMTQQFLNIKEDLAKLNIDLIKSLKDIDSLNFKNIFNDNIDNSNEALNNLNSKAEIQNLDDNINTQAQTQAVDTNITTQTQAQNLDTNINTQAQTQNLDTNINTQTQTQESSNINNQKGSDNTQNFINNLTSNKILFENSDFLKELTLILKESATIKSLLENSEVELTKENNTTLKEPSTREIPNTSKEVINLEKYNLNLDTKNINLNLKNELPSLKKFLSILKENPNLKKETIQVFEKIQNFNSNLKEKLSFKLENSDTKELNEFFNDLKEKVDILKTKFQENQNFTENNREALTSLTNINKNLDFMSYMKNSLYFQIPLNINNESKTAELYVFKDKKNSKTSNEKNGSALISLDLANLGRVETFINKVSKNISLQFRITNEFTETLIKENLPLLESYLSEKDFTISNIQFKGLTESFSLISDIKQTSNPINISSFNTQA